MFVKLSVFVCFQALLIQGFSAQCIGAYNGFVGEGWPVSNALAWEPNVAWPASNALAWEAASTYGNAAPCACSEFSAASPNAASSWAAAPIATRGWGAGYSPANLAASNGGGLAIASVSPITPNGVSMNSENIYEGPLAVAGALPFLGAVALEGALPTGGAGAIAYRCGNGDVAILNEDYNSIYGYGAGIAGPAYNYNGFAGPVSMGAGIAVPAFGYNGIAGARNLGCGFGAIY